jgi:hypothetical protein
MASNAWLKQVLEWMSSEVTRKEYLMFNLTTLSVAKVIYTASNLEWNIGMEHRENDAEGAIPNYWEKILSQWHSVRYKSHKSCPGIDGWEQRAKTEDRMTEMNLWPSDT